MKETKLKTLIVVGTRPEAIKMAPVYQELAKRSWCSPRLMLTGQHRDMARSVLEIFDIKPDLDLDVMQPGQTLVSLASRLTSSLAEALIAEKPDVVLVQGDTNSAMIAGWLGFFAGCRVGHIEAGLRTGNLASPFPEEFNRRTLSLAAHWHFAPTAEAAANLWHEGFRKNVHVVGNTVIDAALAIAGRKTERVIALERRYPFLAVPERRLILVTTHRRENLGRPMEQIAAAVRDLSASFPCVDFVVPVHPNPLVGATLRPTLSPLSNVHLIDPLAYDEMVFALKNSYLVLTDSGGIQEEAPAFDVPVLVLRNETEREEGVAAGCSLLVGTESQAVIDAVTELLVNPLRHEAMACSTNPYGDGNSSAAIADIIGDERC